MSSREIRLIPWFRCRSTIVDETSRKIATFIIGFDMECSHYRTKVMMWLVIGLGFSLDNFHAVCSVSLVYIVINSIHLEACQHTRNALILLQRKASHKSRIRISYPFCRSISPSWGTKRRPGYQLEPADVQDEAGVVAPPTLRRRRPPPITLHISNTVMTMLDG